MLNRIIGEFVDGISKEQMNVGIWSGNVDIANLKLKPAILKKLKIPFQLKFGMIESLKMKVPWKNLSNSAVEVILEGLYLLIIPKDRSSWKDLELDLRQNRHNTLISYVKTIIETMTEKLKLKQSNQSEKGYFGKLVEKIIDNLQIQIKNIHIRLESPAEPIQNISLGITLDSLNIFTCDENWKATFIDRTLDNTKQATVYKNLKINNFYIYWNPEETNFIGSELNNPGGVLLKLKELIYNEETRNNEKICQLNYLLNFSTEGKLKQNRLSSELVKQSVPEFEIMIELEQSNFGLSKDQIQQLSKIINIANDYTKFVSNEEKKFKTYVFRPMEQLSDINQETRKNQENIILKWWKYGFETSKKEVHDRIDPKNLMLIFKNHLDAKEKFLNFFFELFDGKNPENIQNLSVQNRRIYENIIMTYSIEDIKQWLDAKLKDKKEEEERKKMIDKKKGRFGAWIGRQAELTEEDQKAIKDLIEEAATSDEFKFEIPENYPKIKFKLLYKKNVISLSRKEQFQNIVEEIVLQTKNLDLELFFRKNGVKLTTSLQGLKLNYKKKNLKDDTQTVQTLLFCEKTGTSFFSLLIEDHPESNINLDKLIQFNLGSITVVYNAQFVATVTDIFKFEIEDKQMTQLIKEKTKKKIREAKDIGEIALNKFMKEQQKILINFSVNTPQIILPENQQNIKNGPCWIFYPGNLNFNADSSIEATNQNMYDNYSISLSEIQFGFCKNVTEIINRTRSISILKYTISDNFFQIFKDFNIKIDIFVLKKLFLMLNCIDARIKVAANLNELKLNLQPELIKKLMKITSLLMLEEDNEKAKKKRQILKSSKLSGYANYKDKDRQEVLFLCYVSDGLYFYLDPKSDKKEEIFISFQSSLQFSYFPINSSINIKERKGNEIDITFHDEKMYSNLKKQLKIKENELQSQKFIEQNQISFQNTIISKEEPENNQGVLLDIDFCFANLSISILDNEKMYSISTNSLKFKILQQSKKLQIALELGGVQVYIKQNEEIENIISSNYENSLSSKLLKNEFVQKTDKLIVISFEQQQTDQGLEKHAKINFGCLFIDINPGVLNQILKLIPIESPKIDQQQIINESSGIQQKLIQIEFPTLETLLSPYQNSAHKLENSDNVLIDIEITLEIQAINVLMVNQIHKIPLADLIIKDSFVNIKIKKGFVGIEGEFSDLAAYDLTNYPDTLISRDLEKIVSARMFGKQDPLEKQPLLKLLVSLNDPLIYKMPEDNHKMQINLISNNLKVVLHLQKILRVVSFITDQLFPSFEIQSDVSLLQNKYETDFSLKKEALINIFRPYWPKLEINIKDTQIIMPCDSNNHITAKVEQVFISNTRTLNKKRIVKKVEHPLYKMDGVWEDHYNIKVTSLLLYYNDPVLNIRQFLCSPINVDLKVGLLCFEEFYKVLFDSIQNMDYNFSDSKLIKSGFFKEEESSTQKIQIDPSIDVNVQLDPLVLIIGHKEYNFVMKALDWSIVNNDQKDSYFIKDYKQKESQKKPGSMKISVKFPNIALVTLDNDDENKVFAKIFVENSEFAMISHPNGASIMSFKIQNLKGFHLLNTGKNYLEKGFIGDLQVKRELTAKNVQNLQELFIQDILQIDQNQNLILDRMEQIKSFLFHMEMNDTQMIMNLEVNALKILLQTDVLFKILGIIERDKKQNNLNNIGLTSEAILQEEKTKDMSIKIKLSENSFLIPSIDNKNSLVTKGDINIQINIVGKTSDYLIKNPLEIVEKIQNDEYEGLIHFNKINVMLNLIDFEVFLVQFIHIFVFDFTQIPKRPILLPWKLNLQFLSYEFQRMNVYQENKLKSIKKIVIKIENSIQFKMSFTDIELLSSIANYQIAMMEKIKPKEEQILEVTQSQIMKQNNIEQSQLEIIQEDVLVSKINEKENESIIQESKLLNVSQMDQKLDAQKKDFLKDSNSVILVRLGILQNQNITITFISDYHNIFTPTFIFRLGNLNVNVGVRSTIKLSTELDMEIYYFNSDIFRWEPFVEKTSLEIKFKTKLNELGILGKKIEVSNLEHSSLNINVSISFLDKLLFMTKNLETLNKKQKEDFQRLSFSKEVYDFNWLSPENIKTISPEIRNASQSSYISPVRIINNTGYNLSVQYYEKKVQIDSNGNPVLKSVKDLANNITNGESIPLDVEETLEEYDVFNKDVVQNFPYKFINFKVSHPDFQIDQISGLNIVNNYSKKLVLKGKQKNLVEYRLLYNSRNTQDLKEISISSTVKIRNVLDIPLKINVYHPFQHRQLIIQSGEEIFVPFDYVINNFEFIHDDIPLEFKSKFESFSAKESGYFKLVSNKQKTFNFILKVFRDPNFYYLTKLVALPALTLRNNLTCPLQILLNNQRETKQIEIDCNQSNSISNFDISELVQFRLLIPGFQQTQSNFLIENGKLKYEKLICLNDAQNRQAYINIIRLREGPCHYNFAFYCDVIIINETNYQFQYRVADKSSPKGIKTILATSAENIGPYDFLSSKKSLLELNLKNNQNFLPVSFSNQISIEGLGSGVFQMVLADNADPKKPSCFLEIGYSLRLAALQNCDSVASKIIHLKPKTILYNKSKFKIGLANDLHGHKKIIESEQKTPIYLYQFTDKREKKLDFWVESEGKQLRSLVPIDLNKAGTTLFLLTDSEKEKYLLFRIELLIEQDYAFMTFIDRTFENDLTFINNTDFEIIFYQSSHKNDYHFVVKQNQSAEFAFIDPYKERSFNVEFIKGGQLIGSSVVKTENLITEKHIIKKIDQNIELQSVFYLKGEKRVLEFSKYVEKRRIKLKKIDINDKIGLNSVKNSDYMTALITVKSFGISVICSYLNQTSEILYFYLDRINFVYIKAEEQLEIQLRVNYINIDSNYSKLCKYPVLVTTETPLIKMGDKNFLNLHFTLSKTVSDNLYKIELFELELKPIVVTADYSIIGVLQAVKTFMFRIFSKKIEVGYLNKYFIQKPDRIALSSSEWENIQFQTSNKWIYCREFKVSPINLIITFKTSKFADEDKKEQADDLSFDMLKNTLGVTFINIDEAPVFITGLRLESIFDSSQGISRIMSEHLGNQMNINIMRLAGSVDFLGNPISLFSNIGNGVVQLIEKPVEGFIKGPFEGFVGIAQGGGSLLKNTTAGAFNTISKFTGSLASGITSLSLDTDYQKKRNIALSQKPKNVLEGVGKGAFSFGKGVYSGVTGVFTQPIQEIKKEGAVGIFKGVFKGIGGLFLKPIGGVFDAASQTAEGIKNNVKIFDDQANEKKQRIPRVFYSSSQYFKAYELIDAILMRELKTINRGKFESDTFLDAIYLEGKTPKETRYFLITYENFLLLNNCFKFLMSCEVKDLKNLQIVDKTTFIITYFNEGVKRNLGINTSENQLLKIINSLNYCRYVNYTNINFR